MADDFFDGLIEEAAQCYACHHQPTRAVLDDILRGMAGEGPFAGRISPKTTFMTLWRRLSNPTLAQSLGIPPYPRKRSALTIHLQVHRAELWKNVEAQRSR